MKKGLVLASLVTIVGSVFCVGIKKKNNQSKLQKKEKLVFINEEEAKKYGVEGLNSEDDRIFHHPV